MSISPPTPPRLYAAAGVRGKGSEAGMIAKILIVLGIWILAGLILLPFVLRMLKDSDDRLGPPPIK